METGDAAMTNEQKAAKIAAAATLIANEAHRDVSDRKGAGLGGDYFAFLADRTDDFAVSVALLSEETRARLFDLITQDALATA
jgi:hypothetical protein